MTRRVLFLGKNQAKGQGVGFCSPLTKVVATPCYRAPEVQFSQISLSLF